MRGLGIAALCVACEGAVDLDLDGEEHTADGVLDDSDQPVPDRPDPSVPPVPVELVASPNILFVLFDDVGVDKVAAYGVHPEAPPMPTLDALAEEGIRFTRAYAEPTCTPARASLLTGRHPFRHGGGRWIFPETETWSLPDEELTIPELLARAGYTSAIAGKWHLVGYQDESPARHPLRQGFAHHRGSLSNPLDILGPKPNYRRSYTRWQKSTDGVVAMSETYMTTDTTNEAIDFVRSLPEPWFVEVAYNAPHAPFEVPPVPLAGSDTPRNASNADKYDAMLRALDHDLGRLFDTLSDEVRERTLVVVMSDNGTPKAVIRAPLDVDRGKGTVFEGGVRVPLFVSGAGIPARGTVSDALVSVVDWLPTLAELAGLGAEDLVDDNGEALVLDGTSLAPLLRDPGVAREAPIYAETFYPLGPPPIRDLRWTVVDRDHKLLGEANGEVRLYAVSEALDEGSDLLEGELTADDEAALTRLETVFADLDPEGAAR